MNGITVTLRTEYEGVRIHRFPGGSTIRLSGYIEGSSTEGYEIDLLELIDRLGFTKQEIDYFYAIRPSAR